MIFLRTFRLAAASCSAKAVAILGGFIRLQADAARSRAIPRSTIISFARFVVILEFPSRCGSNEGVRGVRPQHGSLKEYPAKHESEVQFLAKVVAEGGGKPEKARDTQDSVAKARAKARDTQDSENSYTSTRQ